MSTVKNRIRKVYKDSKSYFHYLIHKSKFGFSNGTYFKLQKKQPDDSAIQVKFHGKPLNITSSFWFLHSIQELFIDEVYKFNTTNANPVILDCGANWGLSIIYFKTNHPSAKIIAFEPDENVYKLLKTNIQSFGLENVELNKKAVWKQEGTLQFSSEGALGGRLTEDGEGKNTIEVQTARLKDVIRSYEKIDFLKMDIEGAEYEVVKDCVDELHRVERLFIEYHSKPGEPQQLAEILDFVNKAGFRYYIKEAWNNMRFPFNPDTNLYYDLQLNIFCYRTAEIKP